MTTASTSAPRKPRKQTSARLSKIAARYLPMSDAEMQDLANSDKHPAFFRDIRSAMASLLSQDETPRTPKKGPF